MYRKLLKESLRSIRVPYRHTGSRLRPRRLLSASHERTCVGYSAIGVQCSAMDDRILATSWLILRLAARQRSGSGFSCGACCR
jgi:hypothetical protein